MVSFECNPMYVEDVEDRSNTPKAVMLGMLKMSKIDQIHLRAVMLCMSKMSKMGKEHTDTFIIPFLIWYHLNVILCMSKTSQIHLRL